MAGAGHWAGQGQLLGALLASAGAPTGGTTGQGRGSCLGHYWPGQGHLLGALLGQGLVEILGPSSGWLWSTGQGRGYVHCCVSLIFLKC